MIDLILDYLSITGEVVIALLTFFFNALPGLFLCGPDAYLTSRDVFQLECTRGEAYFIAVSWMAGLFIVAEHVFAALVILTLVLKNTHEKEKQKQN